MPKAISHTIKRRGKNPGDGDVEIPVAEDIVTVPGIPVREKEFRITAEGILWRPSSSKNPRIGNGNGVSGVMS